MASLTCCCASPLALVWTRSKPCALAPFSTPDFKPTKNALFSVETEKPTLTLPPPASDAGAAAGAALAAALAPASVDAVVDVSLFEHPLSAAAAHSTNAPVDVPTFDHLSNLSAFQAITVS